MPSLQRLSAIQVPPARAAKAADLSRPMPGKENAPANFEQTPSSVPHALSTIVVTKPFKESKLGITLARKDGGPVTVKGIAAGSLLRGTELRVGMTVRSINGKEVSTTSEIITLVEASTEVTIVASAPPKAPADAAHTLPTPRTAALAEATRWFRSGKGQHQDRSFKHAVVECLDLGLPPQVIAKRIRHAVYPREPLPEGKLTRANDRQYRRILDSVIRVNSQMQKKAKSGQGNGRGNDSKPGGIIDLTVTEKSENDGDMELTFVLEQALDRFNIDGQNKKRAR